METYTFTHAQLFDLLTGVISLRDEYQHCHGRTGDEACGQAVLDTLEGLDAEQELLEMGEKFKPSQVHINLEELTRIRDTARTGLPAGGMTEEQWAKHRLNTIAGKLTRLIESL